MDFNEHLKVPQPFNQFTPTQLWVVARTNFAVSVAQTPTAQALILQVIRPCAELVGVCLCETNIEQLVLLVIFQCCLLYRMDLIHHLESVKG